MLTSVSKRSDGGLIGRSHAIKVLETDIDCAARSDAKVLITGETGVGKEVAAQLIHHRSSRAGSAIVTVNCAGLPDSLLESELFGHVRGSFTGAYRDKPGLLEMAPNGTVFLDEVGEMTMRMQAMMLRFLETGEIQRIGADRSHARVNVRLITATNRDLTSHIAAGAFREDLYYRLNVIRLSIPPLRERAEDIPLLIDYFADIYARQHSTTRPELSSAAMDGLVAYRWPGNIRELKNVVERIVLKHGGRAVRPTDLPSEIWPGPAQMKPAAALVSVAAPPNWRKPEELVTQMTSSGQSFWSTVYPLFMSRDLTRDDVRRIVEIGLERSNGNYRILVELFNMSSGDYKRFLSFLRKHDCHLPFQKFRVTPARLQSNTSLRMAGAGKA